MRWTVVAGLALAAAPSLARAQLSNDSIGIEAGYAQISTIGVDPHVPIALTTTFWIDSGFEATGRLIFAFPRESVSGQTSYYITPALGVRYDLIPDGPLRPQLFAEFAFYQFLESNLPHTSMPALGAGAALELFPHRDVSVQATFAWHHLVILNADDGDAIEALLRISTYF